MTPHQLTLPEPEHRITLRQAAEQWMDDHPQVMDLYRKFARERLATGRRFGLKALTERVRWECAAAGGDDFKINNNWPAYIARRLAREIPEIAGLIECRIAKAADRPVRAAIADRRVDPLTEEPLDES